MSDENDSSLTIATHCAKRRENFPDDVKKPFLPGPGVSHFPVAVNEVLLSALAY